MALTSRFLGHFLACSLPRTKVLSVIPVGVGFPRVLLRMSSHSTKKSCKISNVTSLESEQLLDQSYKKYPQLQEYEKDTVVPYLEKMSSLGFSVEMAIEMLLKYPDVFGCETEKIPLTLEMLAAVGLSLNQRVHLLYRQPGIMNLSKSEIQQRLTLLKSYLTTAETMNVIYKCPKSLVENEHTLEQKLIHLIKTWSHDTKNITNCSVLSYSLNHMLMRHEFLTRSGLFKAIPYNRLIKVQEKEKGSKSPREKYFKPSEIVCTDDKEFLKLCTKDTLSHNELAAFEEIYSTHELTNIEKEGLDEERVDLINMTRGRYRNEPIPEVDEAVSLDKTTSGKTENYYF